MPDRRGILATTAGVMADHGLSIRSAQAETRMGRALQELEVVLAEGAVEPNWGVIGVDLRAHLLDASERRPVRRFRPEGSAEVRIAAHSPGRWAVHISAPDAIGLLAAAAGWLADHGLNVERAEIGGEFGWAFDTFIVSADVSASQPGDGGRPRSVRNAGSGGLEGIEVVAARRMTAFLSGHQPE